jgi:hypothetical protein
MANVKSPAKAMGVGKALEVPWAVPAERKDRWVFRIRPVKVQERNIGNDSLFWVSR